MLDETRECNRNFRIDTKHRLWEKGFVPHDVSSLGLTPSMKAKMMQMMTSTEEELADIKINEWFEPEFFNTNIWYYWASMLAFQPYHSLIEIKRYVVRFMHNITKVEHLTGLLRTKYDQYNSLILPLQKYLAERGVNFVPDTTVTDMNLVINGDEKTVTGLVLGKGDTTVVQAVSEKDVVYFTNGSMTQNSSRGSMTAAPVLNTDMINRGCFSLWEKLASQSKDFGHPEKFAYDPQKTLFVSFSLTVRDYPELFKYIEEKTGNLTGKGGATTFVTSPWFIIDVPINSLIFEK